MRVGGTSREKHVAMADDWPRRARPCAVPGVCVVDDLGDAIRLAMGLLSYTRLLQERPAIVLDIDGTVILNTHRGTSKVVRRIVDMCNTCSNAGIALFVVTARPDTECGSNRRWTHRQLSKCGLLNIKDVYMRVQNDTNFAAFKEAARGDIERRGYSTLCSIGDQFFDHAPSTSDELRKHDDAFVVGFFNERRALQLCVKVPAEAS